MSNIDQEPELITIRKEVLDKVILVLQRARRSAQGQYQDSMLALAITNALKDLGLQ